MDKRSLMRMSPNQQAFLDMIAVSEIGSALLAVSDRGYNVLVGSTPSAPLLFHSYASHPHILNKALDSTAAGRYQILGRYADAYIRVLNLPDFGPASQDKIALEMVRECHALPFIESGLIEEAVTMCSSRWASLPGATYGQHTNKIENLLTAYEKSGGKLA
jgi:muramidase (phage lysozyme)